MNYEDIYIGTIKKVRNYHTYKTYGEWEFVPEFQTATICIGSSIPTFDILSKQAILIKMDEHKYVWLDDIRSFVDEIIINFGLLNNKIMHTLPTEDKPIYVDEASLVPYYPEMQRKNQKLKVKKLKKDVLLDPRIPQGIEH